MTIESFSASQFCLFVSNHRAQSMRCNELITMWRDDVNCLLILFLQIILERGEIVMMASSNWIVKTEAQMDNNSPSHLFLKLPKWNSHQNVKICKASLISKDQSKILNRNYEIVAECTLLMPFLFHLINNKADVPWHNQFFSPSNALDSLKMPIPSHM